MSSEVLEDEAMIEVSGLVRSFGDVRAVDGVSFSIPKGQVVGFIGANGAGKTTTMRVMATLDAPDAGVVKVHGFDVTEDPEAVRSILGWMPDSYGVYDHMMVWDYLDFHARAHGLKGKVRKKRIKEVMEFTDLDEIADRPMGGLSKGMGQRLCLGRTLIHDPEVMILDEPAAGLDPKARIEFKNLIRLLANRHKTIFISSHILSELGEMCDAMLFIEKGQIVHHGSAEDLKRDKSTDAVEIEISVVSDRAKLKEWLQVNPGWELAGESKSYVRAAYDSKKGHDLSVQLKRMISEGLEVCEFRMVERKLEDAFVDILKSTRASGKGGKL